MNVVGHGQLDYSLHFYHLPAICNVNFQFWWPFLYQEIQLLEVYGFEKLKNCRLLISCEQLFTLFHVHPCEFLLRNCT